MIKELEENVGMMEWNIVSSLSTLGSLKNI